jgi:hypothetical protein
MKLTRHILPWGQGNVKLAGKKLGRGGCGWVEFGLETNKVCSSSEADFVEVL